MTADREPPVFRVLLVEDNPGDARLVEKYLSRAQGADFRLERVDSLGKGIERLAEGGIDVVLLDLNLPDSNGFVTFERLIAGRPEAAVVVLTGHDDMRLALRAVREGAQDYMVKRTISTPTLVRACRYAIERKRSEEALRESEERYALAVSGANDGLWDWNLATDESFYSPRWLSMLGLEDLAVEAAPEQWLSRVHPDDLPRLRTDLDAHIGGLTVHLENEHRIRHLDGSYRWVLSRGLAVRDESGTAYRMAGSLTDIHARKMTEQQLLHDALHDALTSLPNWALFMDRLGVAIARSQRHQDHNFAVIFLDLDRFKNINDSLGHTFGDQVLVAISSRLRALLRPEDTVARLGGDEFAVLVEWIRGPSDATRIAERIKEEVERRFDFQGHEVFASASIGIALSTTDYERPEEVLRDADTAMYRAKSLGRARHAIFDEEMHRQVVELLTIETDLRHAVERNEFLVKYQPIVSLKDGLLEGFEALVRWQHPDRGIIYPDEFISVAEETGLIVPIGWFVLQEACRQMKQWRQLNGLAGNLGVSVNLSGRQFGQPDLVDRVRRVLEETDLEPRALRLEMTESMIMDDPDGTIARLEELNDVGVQIHIDDFGTGYSSLSHLHSLPTDAIKIDRSFVSRMGNGNGRMEIVGTIVNLARSLKMQVAAEGLETPEQLAELRSLDCEFGQGYYFSRPVHADEAMALIVRQPKW